jgi:hypothetical protein
MVLTPPAIVRICAPVRHDLFVDFVLQIDPNRPTGANYFVRANSSVGRDISIWIGNPHLRGVVGYRMRGWFDRRCEEPLKKCLLISRLLSAQQTGG